MRCSTEQVRSWIGSPAGLVLALVSVVVSFVLLNHSTLHFPQPVLAVLAATGDFNLACDLPITETINPANETDSFSFAAADGERVEITIIKTAPSGSNFQPYWRLVKNDGSPATPCGSFVLSRQGECGPLSSAAGPYRIEVQDFNRNDTGTYRVHLYRLPAATACDNTPLTCNIPASGTIDSALDSDFFSFNVVENESVRVNIASFTPSGANFQPGWRLLRSDGNPASSCGFFNTLSPVVCGPLPADGNPYRVEVQDFNRDDTGTYLLSINFLVASCQTTAISLTPNPLTVVAGRSENLTTTINQIRNTPTTIQLSSSNSAIAAVPAAMTIPANAAIGSFPVTGVSVGGPVTITATLPISLGGGSATANVNVIPPSIGGALIEVLPENPSTTDNISIRISGVWPNSCIPANPQATRVGNEIRIATSNPGQICLTVLTSWSYTLNIGQLQEGNYQVIVNHLAAGVLLELGRRSFTVSTTPITRIVRVANTNANPGGSAGVPITIDAQGNENAVSLSLSFNTAILSNPQVALGGDATSALLTVNANQVAQGRLGVLLSLPAGQVFTAGTRQLILVTFAVAAGTTATNTIITPVEQPVPCQVSDALANLLPVNCLTGVVTIIQGLEADVAPRPNGNGSLSIADCVQVGRFIAGIDAPSTGAGGEFQRTDSAPKETRGDGRLAITDWVQACRYASALDPAQPTGGPTSPIISSIIAAKARAADLISSTGRAITVKAAPGDSGSMVVGLNALGDESAVGFSLRFDPTAWRFVSASASRVVQENPGLMLNLNTDSAAQGLLGFAISQAPGQSFAPGSHEIAQVRLIPVSNSVGKPVSLAFDDLPVAREISDAAARALPASFLSGSNVLRRIAIVSAASFRELPLPSESIATVFGIDLASATQAASAYPLPTELAGASVRIFDSAGVERLAPLFFVSPTQINYLVPAGTAPGIATVVISKADGAAAMGSMEIDAVGPALFTANADGRGVAAALILRVRADGTESFEPAARFDPVASKMVPSPIAIESDSGDQLFLILFGTGLRGRNTLGDVSARLGGIEAPVLFVGAQGEFAGLDQINLSLPRSLIGKGEVEVVLTIDGKTTNPVKLMFR